MEISGVLFASSHPAICLTGEAQGCILASHTGEFQMHKNYWLPANAILFLSGFVTSAVTWLILSRFFGETDAIKGLTFLSAGMAVSIADLIYRQRQNPELRYWRFFSSEHGGAVYIFPGWLLGIGLMATAIAFMLGMTQPAP